MQGPQCLSCLVALTAPELPPGLSLLDKKRRSLVCASEADALSSKRMLAISPVCCVSAAAGICVFHGEFSVPWQRKKEGAQEAGEGIGGTH